MKILIVIILATLIYPFQLFSQYFLGEITKKSFLIIALNENQFDFVSLEKGTLVILNDQKPVNGYFTCYDIESEKLGIIDSKNVKVHKEIIKQENSQIQSQSYSQYYEPRIHIFNNTSISSR